MFLFYLQKEPLKKQFRMTTPVHKQHSIISSPSSAVTAKEYEDNHNNTEIWLFIDLIIVSISIIFIEYAFHALCDNKIIPALKTIMELHTLHRFYRQMRELNS